jgi:predicted nucleic acid-binding protein
MILADTSVWIDLLNGSSTPETALLAAALYKGDVMMGDLILVEILQGMKSQTRNSRAAFAFLDCVTLCGPGIARLAAENYSSLRRAGVTVRGTIDVIIATWCIENRVPLLETDRDFIAIGKRLGLKRLRQAESE